MAPGLREAHVIRMNIKRWILAYSRMDAGEGGPPSCFPGQARLRSTDVVLCLTLFLRTPGRHLGSCKAAGEVGSRRGGRGSEHLIPVLAGSGGVQVQAQLSQGFRALHHRHHSTFTGH